MKIERVQDWKNISDQIDGYYKGHPYRSIAKKVAATRLRTRASRMRRRNIPDRSYFMRKERRILPRFLPRHGKLRFRSSVDMIRV